jgi:hypothetical protein
MNAPAGSIRTSWKRVGVILAVLFGSPLALNIFDGWWTKPRAREASETFEKLVTPGISVADITSKAKELNADRIELLSSEDVIGNPRTPAAIVVWKAYHFWAGRYICVVPLKQGKAESIKCHGDFI